jgi:predicted membrane channel-forming protein YqfA (hemolysin III family)
MTTAAIDAHLLLKVLYTSLIAGVGVSVVFSIAVLGVVRSSDARRDERPTAAVSYAVLGAVGLILTAGLIVYGLILLARKS